MPEIKIGERVIGDGHPAYIIAEIGVNHNGFLDLAIKLIDVAVDAGADAVKFQKRDLDKLYAKKYLDNANAGEKTLRYLLPILQQVELSDGDYDEIVEYCQKKTSRSWHRHLTCRALISSTGWGCLPIRLLPRT